jgi:hypothetical protein
VAGSWRLYTLANFEESERWLAAGSWELAAGWAWRLYTLANFEESELR